MTRDFNSGFAARTYTSADGLRLFARDYGAADPRTRQRLPVICLPGLTRNSRDFHQLALLLSTDANAPRRVIALDYRGRGLSQWDNSKATYNLVAEAEDVLTAMTAFEIEKAAFIGTSRGGLTLHLLAAMRPDLLSGVILNDIGPVIENAGLALIQSYLTSDRKPMDWDDAVLLLRKIHGAAFPALAEHDWQDMARAIYVESDGNIVADFDPAIAEQLAGADLSQPVPDLWPQFERLAGTPLMAIRGENSTLLSPETVVEMRDRHPGMITLTAKGQGHAPLLHLADIPGAVKNFLSDV
ncbi:alpha/beta hydrolase [Rhizobiaceae bacterium n13]|uniref:Alpha/beta hydrolase n=1 Tax=Ferirhizobium litorale TaxID=2927786 RepID=A0AAE3U0F3_9HYPH|nr:alpha/beta hydrolase [Fererhizobium litorale]MDI7861149.1 alpha/beta hydrolase [Fererhizobium litorale]MDI7921296.1 alpha/beta hydrolase [Fererhizobium litorale]